ncbi:uncharacterized protein MYCFIDRAFT_172768 [Pseudocercospora fijiensis CIRAD86]|uniref:Uncharacterized protein n=1 Tax=Pseudocercospora fijiensis (strain CIRAD86) TaxID=383855 RepID=M3BCU9_PSEFD|nr:uncharacterized protein MYCFIDRAFT_172768 [Pseudocercospora fijiensis CIRAD86]EME87102.1 hypothetical protein MYCFIDRAFT_172768 [Pseudocercospora fijiensis CIRAD86]
MEPRASMAMGGASGCWGFILMTNFSAAVCWASSLKREGEEEEEMEDLLLRGMMVEDVLLARSAMLDFFFWFVVSQWIPAVRQSVGGMVSILLIYNGALRHDSLALRGDDGVVVVASIKPPIGKMSRVMSGCLESGYAMFRDFGDCVPGLLEMPIEAEKFRVVCSKSLAMIGSTDILAPLGPSESDDGPWDVHLNCSLPLRVLKKSRHRGWFISQRVRGRLRNDYWMLCVVDSMRLIIDARLVVAAIRFRSRVIEVIRLLLSTLMVGVRTPPPPSPTALARYAHPIRAFLACRAMPFSPVVAFFADGTMPGAIVLFPSTIWRVVTSAAEGEVILLPFVLELEQARSKQLFHVSEAKEQTALDEFQKDSSTGQAFDGSISEAVNNAKANKQCSHKTGDLLKQAAQYLRTQARRKSKMPGFKGISEQALRSLVRYYFLQSRPCLQILCTAFFSVDLGSDFVVLPADAEILRSISAATPLTPSSFNPANVYLNNAPLT